MSIQESYMEWASSFKVGDRLVTPTWSINLNLAIQSSLSKINWKCKFKAFDFSWTLVYLLILLNWLSQNNNINGMPDLMADRTSHTRDRQHRESKTERQKTFHLLTTVFVENSFVGQSLNRTIIVCISGTTVWTDLWLSVFNRLNTRL